jgi:hypothetical protein
MGIDKDHFITTEDIAATAKKWNRKLDLIVVTKCVSDALRTRPSR